MARIAPLALALCSPLPAAAAPAAPSFESAAAAVQASLAATRTALLKEKAGSLEPRMRNMTATLDRYGFGMTQVRTDLGWLLDRVRRVPPGRPDADPSLRWDLQRFTQDLSQITRESQARLNELKMITAEAAKDESLVKSARNLAGAAEHFRSETSWFMNDARWASFDLSRAGYSYEGMQLDRDSKEIDRLSRQISDEAVRLLAKVKGA